MATLARKNVSRATARSVLAVVAILIGVVAVGGIGLGGEAFKQNQLAAYEGFGDVATVMPVRYAEANDDRTFTDQELDRLRQSTESATVTPIIEPAESTVRTPSGELLVTAQVKGIEDPGQFYDLQAGRFPTTTDRGIVVGSRLATEQDIVVGDRVTVAINDSFTDSYRVTGILESQGFSDPLQADRSVFVPVSEFDDPEYTEVIVEVDPQEGSLNQTTARIEDEFNQRGNRRVFVSQVRDQRDQFEQFFNQINQFLIGISAVAMVVAAVTITNTILMSVTERTAEIGVLRAVGYPKFAIVRLILSEATVLGVIGVLIGIPLTLAIGGVINYYLLGDPLAFTSTGLSYVAVGAVLGIAIAFVGGLYPAWKAASKKPVEALE